MGFISEENVCILDKLLIIPISVMDPIDLADFQWIQIPTFKKLEMNQYACYTWTDKDELSCFI